MGVKWKTKFDKLPEISETVEMMGERKVKVGALKGDHAWFAGIHEYGAHITAKNGKYLIVPVHPKAKGKKASSFNDLWTLKANSGELFLCRNKGKNDFEVLYWITKSVKIPERSFLRTGHDENVNSVITQTERAIGQVVAGKMSIDDMLDVYGEQMAASIKKYMRDLSRPSNSKATMETKGSSNPLVDTGGLIGSIHWKKE